MNEVSTKPWTSKTILMAVVTAIAPFIPGGAEFIAEHTATIGIVWGALAVIIRLATKDAVVLRD